MKKFFITYGDGEFAASKRRILAEARSLRLFDDCRAYAPEDLSEAILNCPAMREKRGGGLWIWKPDIIFDALQAMDEGDFLVYCDAGCSLQSSRDWRVWFDILSRYDICALRIDQRNDRWTRREIIDHFGDGAWLSRRQCCATVIIVRKSEFVMDFISEWRDTILEYPHFVMDVPSVDRSLQLRGFIENRHDQSVYSALVYKYLDTGRIKIRWEHIEGHDYFRRQAIRATRLRGEEMICESNIEKLILFFKGFLRHFMYLFKFEE